MCVAMVRCAVIRFFVATGSHTLLRRLSRRRRLGRPCLVSTKAPQPALLSSCRRGRGAGSLARRRGPVVGTGQASSEPLSAPSVRPICAAGPRSPFGWCAACPARPGPAHFGSLADPCLLRSISPPGCAPPLRPLPPAPAQRRACGSQSLRQGLCALRRSLSPPAQARAHGRACLPRSPSPCHLCGRICAVGPRSPFGWCAACLARPGPAHFGSQADPPALPAQVAARGLFLFLS